MAYREARATARLLQQLDELHPSRSRASDGWIGDPAHQARGNDSDHNPWVTLDGMGIVTARDFTHDPAGGVDGDWLSEIARHDGRTKYVIWDRRIASGGEGWREYYGDNPHTGHVHVSVLSDPAHYDDAQDWALGEDDMAGYNAWGTSDRDHLLDDITHYALPHVEVPIFGGGTEPLLSALMRLSRVERTLFDLKAQLTALAGELAPPATGAGTGTSTT